MPDYSIVLPSKPRPVVEEERSGMFEIDGLSPGYGHTLGNSLRRIILSSLPGAAVTRIKIDDVPHEFSTIKGVKEDVITLVLNLKRLRVKMLSDEAQTFSLNVKGPKKVTAKDFNAPGQIEILNPDLELAEVTEKGVGLNIEITIEKGLGYVAKEMIKRDKTEAGTITPDAIFTPIRRVNYEVENMRVGDRTDFNRLRIFIETDGTLTPREALERSIEIMINQLRAIRGFQETEEASLAAVNDKKDEGLTEEEIKKEADEEGSFHPLVHNLSENDKEFLKTRIESLEELSARTVNALTVSNIRTVGGLARKSAEDILALDGIGEKALEEIKKVLGDHGIVLK